MARASIDSGGTRAHQKDPARIPGTVGRVVSSDDADAPPEQPFQRTWRQTVRACFGWSFAVPSWRRRKPADRTDPALAPLPRKAAKWHLVYFALAAFDVLTVTGSLYLTHRILGIYIGSVDINEQWVERRALYSELGQLATQVDAPGNDVFDTHDVEAETERRDRALVLFEERMREARAELIANVPSDQAAPLLASLDRVTAAMREMVAEADLIFHYFRLGDATRAGRRMATMDRKYHGVLRELHALAGQVDEIQERHFHEQIAAAQELRQAEYLIAGLIGLMIGCVVVYGHKMVRKARADEEAFERYSIGLAKARDEAAAASRARSDFLAVMSHEIRTPMTAVLGMADLLASDKLSERHRQRVNAIRTSGRHLLGIINNILDFTRLDAGRLELERVDLRIAEILEQVRSVLGPQATERGLQLRIGLDPSTPPVVRGDPTALRQVLLNLVGNGLKFTHHGAVSVTVSPRPAGDAGRVRLRFEVRDTGIGIPQERQAELFEPFVQVDRSTTRRYGGSGLGLAISRRLLHAMDGVIGVASSPGEGSLFWFELPFEVGTGEAAVREKVAPVPAPASSPLRVLVVEDVEVNRELLGEMLTREGHNVVFARDGGEAVALAARERFDVIVMDVHMPVMDGLEATRRIRRLGLPAGAVPIVGLSANVLEEERRRYLAAGMDRCLTKPIAWPELFSALAGAARSTGKAAAPVPGSGARGPQPPVLDPSAARMTADAVSMDLLRRVVDDTERSCERLGAWPPGSPEQLEEAHRLKGTAGLFGLRRVSAAAAEVEAGARSGQDTAAAMARLAAAVAATRDELAAREVSRGPPEGDATRPLEKEVP